MKHTSSGTTSGLVSLIALVLVGCASSPEAPAPSGMRRVFLSSSPSVNGTYQSEEMVGGTPTDHFDAKEDRGYLYLVFNDGNAHTYQFRVTKVDNGAVLHRTARMEVPATTRPVQWQSYSHWFAIAGWLSPGAYVLELTIDDRAAGVYPFTVLK